MKPYIDDDFLLHTDLARRLYHGHAAALPIIDYHCHISPADIAQNRCYENITQLWLEGDHYKWRLMRSAGVPEQNITGGGSDYDKFLAFAQTLEKAYGNPMHHWCHLELRRYFGYDGVLNADSAEEVWALCNQKLPQLPVRGILAQSNVEVICTTDDPLDDLAAHSQLAADGSLSTRVLPGWRPDRALNLEDAGFLEYIRRLSQLAGVVVKDLDSLQQALCTRLDVFERQGCRVADHGLATVPYAPRRRANAEAALRQALTKEPFPDADGEAYRYELLHFLGGEYAKRGWVMQLHLGAVRNVNTGMFRALGADAGFDCIGDACSTEKLTGFLDSLAKRDALPKTILYSLNPSDNQKLASVIGCFQDQSAPGKLQHGAAWWFNDTKAGIEEQLQSLASLSLLGNFVGMLTDSRSFLSYVRHEYFRRILCSRLAAWAEAGEVPADEEVLRRYVQDISYQNARRYFAFT